MSETVFTIEGMSCQHCVAAVKKAVDAVDGVSASEVTVGSARVAYDDASTGSDAIARAIEAAGYKIKQ